MLNEYLGIFMHFESIFFYFSKSGKWTTYGLKILELNSSVCYNVSNKTFKKPNSVRGGFSIHSSSFKQINLTTLFEGHAMFSQQ